MAGAAQAVDNSSAGSGLRTRIDRVDSSTMAGPWSARFGWSEAALDPTLANPVTARLSWQWLGDYRFAPDWGLRATGGLRGQFDLAGPQAMAGGLGLAGGRAAGRIGAGQAGGGLRASDGNWTSPYLGVGYDASASLRNGWGAWGLSADLGLLTRRAPSQGLHWGHGAEGDDSWRSLRLAPVLQVGVSYSF